MRVNAGQGGTITAPWPTQPLEIRWRPWNMRNAHRPWNRETWITGIWYTGLKTEERGTSKDSILTEIPMPAEEICV